MDDRKKCSFCGEDIASMSKRCPYCGSLLETEVGEMSRDIDQNTWDKVSSDSLDVTGNNPEQHNTQQKADAPPDSTGYPTDSSRPQNPYGGYDPYYNSFSRPNYGQTAGYSGNKGLSNGMKVFLTAICVAVPGLGQLAGIILSIVFMNSESDEDKKSFGTALLIACLCVFVVSCLSCFVFAVALSTMQGGRVR